MGDETKKTPSDAPDAPLVEPKVDVTVKPVERRITRDMPRELRERVGRQNGQNVDKAEKIAKGLEREIREAVRENTSGGKGKQLDAAREAADRVATDQPPGQIERIDVDVGGNKSTHKPPEKAPPPPPAEKK